MAKKRRPVSTKDKIQDLLQKKQELKGTVTQIGVHGVCLNYGSPPKDAIERACSMKEVLLRKIELFGKGLPLNTHDQLIDELGGTENVAEMTRRKGRVVQADDVRNQRRRVHITFELSWSADRAIQQFGRTHRSNQVNAPEYIFLISDLAGERRFALTVAKRLESLGALTHETVMKTIMDYKQPLVPSPTDYRGDFFNDIAGALVGVGIIANSERNPGVLSLDKDYKNISKFLNRILGIPVKLQNRLFKYFTDTLAAIIKQAKKGGRFDLDILHLGAAEAHGMPKRVKVLNINAVK
uniref:Strawberry notch helicase C domain-containing protein n=1 Tax=Glossina brevipalpis TaxID=37001 RepID=A0A1A9WV68_9MUSC